MKRPLSSGEKKLEPKQSARLTYLGLASFIFLVSGFSSLTFQVAWRRILSQEIGVDFAAVTFVVAIFIAGLGIGGYLGGVLSRCAMRRRPIALVLAYVICEVLVGAYGVTSESLLRWIGVTSAEHGVHNLFALFTFYLIALLPPTICMGATLPLMLQIGDRFVSKVGDNVGLLYGLNIFGAAFGALAADFYLLEALGVRGTLVAASVLNFCFPIVFLVLFRAQRFNRAREVVAQTHVGRDFQLRLLLLSGAFGFLTLSLEMILFRVTAHYLQSNAYAFSIMLFCYLLMMGAGNLLFGTLSERVHPGNLLTAITLAFFVSVVMAFHAQQFLAVIYPGNSVRIPGLFPYPSENDLDKIISVSFIMIPVFFASGFFPSMIRLLAGAGMETGRSAGLVYFCFSIGNAIGVVCTGLILMPTIGTVNTMRGILMVTAVAVLILLYKIVPLVGIRQAAGNSVPRSAL